ncbi:MAG: hypothetical protein V3U10_02330 [Bacteroidota bacterium]
MKALSIFTFLLSVIAVPFMVIQKKPWQPVLLPIKRDENVRYDVDTMFIGGNR